MKNMKHNAFNKQTQYPGNVKHKNKNKKTAEIDNLKSQYRANEEKNDQTAISMSALLAFRQDTPYVTFETKKRDGVGLILYIAISMMTYCHSIYCAIALKAISLCRPRVTL